MRTVFIPGYISRTGAHGLFSSHASRRFAHVLTRMTGDRHLWRVARALGGNKFERTDAAHVLIALEAGSI